MLVVACGGDVTDYRGVSRWDAARDEYVQRRKQQGSADSGAETDAELRWGDAALFSALVAPGTSVTDPGGGADFRQIVQVRAPGARVWNLQLSVALVSPVSGGLAPDRAIMGFRIANAVGAAQFTQIVVLPTIVFPATPGGIGSFQSTIIPGLPVRELVVEAQAIFFADAAHVAPVQFTVRAAVMAAPVFR